MYKILIRGYASMVRRAEIVNAAEVTYTTSYNLLEGPQVIKLKMPNEFGFVSNAEVLLNTPGQKPGEAGYFPMEYVARESTNETSVFAATISHQTLGYKTFVISMYLNGCRKFVKRDFPKKDAVLTDFCEGQFCFWETFIYCQICECANCCNLGDGVVYQIFPETFFKMELSEKYQNQVSPWDSPIRWQPDENGIFRNDQYFGGTIRGIISKLDHIRSLGTTTIYLCPVYLGGSSNRYDIIDYERIDPRLGTWEDLEELHQKANANGMKLLIDAVYNHSSIFNPLLKQAPELYKWERYPDKPKTWWGYEHLPEFNQENEAYFFHLTKWLGKITQYCDGVRLDVADSLTSRTLRHIKATVGEKVFVLGEVWKDAIVGEYRSFLIGNELDAVMNYCFPNAIYRYLRFGNCDYFKSVVTRITELYPPRALRCSPIFLTSHDIPRLPNMLVDPYMQNDPNRDYWNMENSADWIGTDGNFDTIRFREYGSIHSNLTPSQWIQAKKLRKLALFLQYTLPGQPVIFAGDELGVTGLKDPFNRMPLPWENIDQSSYDLYYKMGDFRTAYKQIFTEADFEIIHCDQEMLLYRRGKIFCAINRTERELELPDYLNDANILFSMGDSISGNMEMRTNGLLPAMSVSMFEAV